MMSSEMPSEKYSCSGSELMLSNGSTAIDGLSSIAGGAASVDPAVAGASDSLRIA